MQLIRTKVGGKPFTIDMKGFIVNYADLAEIMGASAIVIGDPSVAQSMSQDYGGNARWSQLIADVRARFSGQIVGVVALPSTQSSFDWIKDVDLIYVLFSPSFYQY